MFSIFHYLFIRTCCQRATKYLSNNAHIGFPLCINYILNDYRLIIYHFDKSLANFQGKKSTDINKESSEGSGLNEYIRMQLDPSINWNDIKWLQSITKLPIVVKGIMTAEDAELCANIGIAGIIVSNHGARQVDGTASTVNIN